MSAPRPFRSTALVAAFAATLSTTAAVPARGQRSPAEDPAVASPPPRPAPVAEPASGELTADQRYRRGKGLFDYGDCGPAIATLAPLAVPGQLQDGRAQLDVHLMLGVCYALAGQQLEATRELSSVLSIDPDYSLDPFLTPPAALELFERQKAAMKVQLEEIRRVREQAKAAGFGAEGGVLVERTTVIKDVPLATAFLPFGFAQAANDENVKAVVIGATQGVTLAATLVGFYGSILTLPRKVVDPADEDPALVTYHTWLGVQYVAAMAFTLAYAYGVGDALWNREDGAVVEKSQTRRALTAAEIEQLKRIAPAPAPAPAAPPVGAPPP